MNQNRLQEKRRKRQAARKEARARARRRNLAIGEKQRRDAVRSRTATERPNILGRLRQALGGGVQITPEQPDAEAAPIVAGDR